MDAQISNVGHLYKIVTSKTFMLFGSHSASKGQERVKKNPNSIPTVSVINTFH